MSNKQNCAKCHIHTSGGAQKCPSRLEEGKVTKQLKAIATSNKLKENFIYLKIYIISKLRLKKSQIWEENKGKEFEIKEKSFQTGSLNYNSCRGNR